MRIHATFIWAITAISFLAVPAFASYTVNIAAAKDLIARGQYDQAVSLLDETIAENPESAEGHYLLGVAHLWKGGCGSACEWFRKALELDPSLQDPMREQVKERIFERLRDGDMEGARSALTVVVKYDPSLGREIAQACVRKGGGYLDTGDAELADELFRFIAEVEPSLSSSICELLFAKARSATGEESLKLVVASLGYGSRYQSETVRMLLRLANDLDDEGTRQEYLAKTSSYIEPGMILQASIDYYTGMWGQPGKLSLSNPGKWVALEKTKKDDILRYLTSDRVSTRGVGGPMKLPAAVYRTALFPGQATPTEAGYTEKVWFTSESDAATVYYWFLPAK